MKEGSIGTRNCTVNTEKNVVARRTAADAEETKELRKKGETGGIAKKKRGGTDRKKGRKRAREELGSNWGGKRNGRERGEGVFSIGEEKPKGGDERFCGRSNTSVVIEKEREREKERNSGRN